MGSPDVAADVIAIVAEERGRKSSEIKLSHRLLDDLGMDGDDAVDFFTGLKRRYNVDLNVLDREWDRHFGPEGLQTWILLPVLAFPVWVGLVGMHVEPIQAALVFPVALVSAGCLFIRARNRRRRRPYIPVTVKDVADAVSSGSWQMNYD